MNKTTLLSLLFLSFLVGGAAASTTWINSPYSTVTSYGNGTFTLTDYTDPIYKINATGQWADFTSNMTWNQTGTGEIINWTYNQTPYSVFVKNLGPQWQVVNNGGGLSLWFNVTVPQTQNGTFTTFFPSTWTPYWQGVNSSSFCGYGICLGFPDYNRQGDLNGSFNSTVAIYVNASNNLVVQINYSCSLLAGCPETFDPFVSQGPSDDMSLFNSLDASATSVPYLKFLTSGIPANATILDAEMALDYSGNKGTSPTSKNASIFNATTDWNQSGNITFTGSISFNYTGNYSIVNKTTFGYYIFNVTNSYGYAYANGFNATYIVTATNGLCGIFSCSSSLTSGLIWGPSSGPFTADYVFNSTRATGFFPQLNITYTVSGLNWFNPSVTSTSAGASSVASVLWTDLNENLSNATFTFNQGNGTFINYSTISMTGISNYSNFTFTNNATIGTNESWGVYAYDNVSDLNFTGFINFTTTTGIIAFTNESTCANVTAQINVTVTSGDNLSFYQFSVNNNTGSFINYTGPIAFVNVTGQVINYSWCAVVDTGSIDQWEVYVNNTGGYQTVSSVFPIFTQPSNTLSYTINPSSNSDNNYFALVLLGIALVAISLKSKNNK